MGGQHRMLELKDGPRWKREKDEKLGEKNKMMLILAPFTPRP